MSVIKQKRAANQLQIALSSLIRDELNDPRLQNVTVTEVRLDREMEHATIFVAALAGDAVQEDVLAGLTSAAGFLRRALGQRLHVRRVPVLHFHWDLGLAHGERIAQLLEELHHEDAPAGTPAVAGAGAGAAEPSAAEPGDSENGADGEPDSELDGDPDGAGEPDEDAG